MKFLSALKKLAIVAVIALITAVLILIFKNLCNLGILPEKCKVVCDSVVGAFAKAILWIKDVMFPWIGSAFHKVIDFFVNGWHAISSFCVTAWNAVSQFFVTTWEAVSGFFTKLFTKA